MQNQTSITHERVNAHCDINASASTPIHTGPSVGGRDRHKGLSNLTTSVRLAQHRTVRHAIASDSNEPFHKNTSPSQPQQGKRTGGRMHINAINGNLPQLTQHEWRTRRARINGNFVVAFEAKPSLPGHPVAGFTPEIFSGINLSQNGTNTA